MLRIACRGWNIQVKETEHDIPENLTLDVIEGPSAEAERVQDEVNNAAGNEDVPMHSDHMEMFD